MFSAKKCSNFEHFDAILQRRNNMYYLFGKRFYELRKEHNYTQHKLAKLLNISRSTISKYESGDLFPTTHTLIKIARVFKVSVDYLIGLSDKR